MYNAQALEIVSKGIRIRDIIRTMRIKSRDLLRADKYHNCRKSAILISRIDKLEQHFSALVDELRKATFPGTKHTAVMNNALSQAHSLWIEISDISANAIMNFMDHLAPDNWDFHYSLSECYRYFIEDYAK